MNDDVTDTLLMNSGSVECTSGDSPLHLFRNYVYYHSFFQKLIIGGLE